MASLWPGCTLYLFREKFLWKKAKDGSCKRILLASLTAVWDYREVSVFRTVIPLSKKTPMSIAN
jgi:hypothetical protein